MVKTAYNKKADWWA